MLIPPFLILRPSIHFLYCCFLLHLISISSTSYSFYTTSFKFHHLPLILITFYQFLPTFIRLLLTFNSFLTPSTFFITFHLFLLSFILLLLTFYHLLSTLYCLPSIKKWYSFFFYFLVSTNPTILFDVMLRALIFCFFHCGMACIAYIYYNK